MNLLRRRSPARSLLALVLFAATLIAPGRAQSAATGTIEGRVLNTTNGAYLNNARVTVEGTTLQAFTNEFGEYRLSDVPAGAAAVRVFFTGLPSQSAQVSVGARQTVTHDFNLTNAEVAGTGTTV
jgi:hypothetical protein